MTYFDDSYCSYRYYRWLQMKNKTDWCISFCVYDYKNGILLTLNDNFNIQSLALRPMLPQSHGFITFSAWYDTAVSRRRFEGGPIPTAEIADIYARYACYVHQKMATHLRQAFQQIGYGVSSERPRSRHFRASQPNGHTASISINWENY